MKIFSGLLPFFFTVTAFAQQPAWPDTSRISVSLKNYVPGKKVVEAFTGRTRMYFSQKEYLGKEDATDTIKTSPRYFDDNRISQLLKEGKANIVLAAGNTPVTEIKHQLKHCGSTATRFFYLPDGTVFFSRLEITGIMSNMPQLEFDSTDVNERLPPAPKKDFKTPEEFPDRSDHTKIRFLDYFPLDTSRHYVYQEPGNTFGYSDTIGCKKGKAGKQFVFYFPEEGYHKYNLVSTGTTNFAGGVYFPDNGALYTLEADYEDAIDELDTKNAALLFPAMLQTGDSSTIVHGMERTVYTYISREDVWAGKTLYKDCVKIKMLTWWPETVYISYAWFAKDVGMVKWIRQTGRVDELISVYKK